MKTIKWENEPSTNTPINAENLNIMADNNINNASSIGVYEDTYSVANTYNLDSIVVYNGTLYKCITAITTAEAFDEKKWQKIGILDGNKINNAILKNNIDDTLNDTSANPVQNKTIYEEFALYETDLRNYSDAEFYKYSNINDSNIGVPESYDATKTYNINDIVRNDEDGLNYKCITAITTAEEFNSKHWTIIGIIDYNKIDDLYIQNSAIATTTINGLMSATDKTKLESILIAYTLIDEVLKKVLAMLGLDTQTFSSTSTYIVGSYVVYENKLWKCTTAVTTAGAWTGSTNWTQSYLFKFN